MIQSSVSQYSNRFAAIDALWQLILEDAISQTEIIFIAYLSLFTFPSFPPASSLSRR
jgi:hypothetical protein